MRRLLLPVSTTMASILLASGVVRAQSDAWFKLERIDVQPGGAGTGTRYAITDPAVSDDGRWIAFASAASDLIANDTNAAGDIFLRDRRTQTTRRLSVRPNGSPTTASSRAPAMTSSGRFVSFVSGDKLLVGNDENFQPDQFLLDRDTDGNGVFDDAGGAGIELVSLGNDNATFFNGTRNVVGAVNEAGTSVSFVSLQPLVGNDTNGANDVYVRDRPAQASRLLSESTAAMVGNDDSPDFFQPPVRTNDSGSLVVFSSDAGNLDPNLPGSGLFLRNRDSDGNGIFDEPLGSTTSRITIAAPGGGIVSTGPFQQFSLSRDGRWLAVAAADTQGSNPAGTDIFLHDFLSGVDSPIPFDAGDWVKGAAGCCGNQVPIVSRAAEVTVFSSNQSYAFDNVSTGRSDVFVQARNRPLKRITDFGVPTAIDDGYSFGAAAMSANGIYLIVGIFKAGAASGPDEGYFIYQRDDVFDNSFEASP